MQTNNKRKDYYGTSCVPVVNNHRGKDYKIIASIATLILALSCLTCAGKQMPAQDIDKIADAIYVIEGGNKTKHPYGVLSVHVSNKAEARAICKRTIANNYGRWLKQKKEPDYFIFLAGRYCPAESDPTGHKNWINNIKKILGKVFIDKINSS